MGASDLPSNDRLVIDEMRQAWSRGVAPSAILRTLQAKGFRGASLIVLMQDVFALALSTMSAVSRWINDGDDERLDRLLSPRMPPRTQG